MLRLCFLFGMIRALAALPTLLQILKGPCCELVRHPDKVDVFQFQCSDGQGILNEYSYIIPSFLCGGFRRVDAPF